MQLSTHQKPVSPVVFTLRSVQPCDAQALDALIESLSNAERRWRFHGAVNGLSAQTLKRLTCVDSAQHVAYVVHAHDERGAILIADGRFALDDDSGRAEMALMVSPAWRGRGIGRLVLSALMRAASQAGVRVLHGTVLLENVAMQRLLSCSGFQRVSRVHTFGARSYESVLVPDPIAPRTHTGDRRVSRSLPAWIASPWTVRQSTRGLEV
ncbi:MAG: hypothetical protein RL341_2113 [Pseudomonadota bacterium]|jgi:acetyltransferase